MTWHTEAVGGGVPIECTCPREACGAVVTTSDCAWHHPQRAGMYHRVEDCAEIQTKRAIRAAGNAAAKTLVNRVNTTPEGMST